MINNGKRFEKEVKDSIPPYCFYYRFKDGTASFGGESDNVRFQASNMCDCLVFNSQTKFLWFIELKTHKGKSIPLSAIRQNQITELLKASMFKGINAGLIINFRDIEKCYWVHIQEIQLFIDGGTRKSISIDWCKEYGTEIVIIKKRTSYRLELEELFKI